MMRRVEQSLLDSSRTNREKVYIRSPRVQCQFLWIPVSPWRLPRGCAHLSESAPCRRPGNRTQVRRINRHPDRLNYHRNEWEVMWWELKSLSKTQIAHRYRQLISDRSAPNVNKRAPSVAFSFNHPHVNMCLRVIVVVSGFFWSPWQSSVSPVTISSRTNSLTTLHEWGEKTSVSPHLLCIHVYIPGALPK